MAVIKPNFRKINILLADSDPYLAQTIIHCLRALGFTNVRHVRTADEAIKEVRFGTTSFLITEWDMKGSSGIELVKYVRRHPESPNRTLPIIMLTGRGEMTDVCIARDVGITEFLVKPFTVQTLYHRISQIIDNPRSFVLAQGYVGPERRRQGTPPPGVSDRRVITPTPSNTPKSGGAKIEPGKALILSPDMSLRQSLGGNTTFAKMITPEALASAQKTIDAMADESLTWVREDLRQMQESHENLTKLYSPHHFDLLKEGALSIKSRSGTFGYRMASDCARLLYLFLSVDFLPTHPRHLLVIQKYLEVLKVIFAQGIKERNGIGEELYKELVRLTSIP